MNCTMHAPDEKKIQIQRKLINRQKFQITVDSALAIFVFLFTLASLSAAHIWIEESWKNWLAYNSLCAQQKRV